MATRNNKCDKSCDCCTHAVHAVYEVEEWGGDIYGCPIHCEKYPDEEHDKICESCGYCEGFDSIEKEKRTRGSRRRSDWKHAKRKKNKSYYYCKDRPWYSNLHQYSKNKIHCSCPMCRCKTNNKHKPFWEAPMNWPITDKKKLENMKEQVEEEWLENYRDLP